MPIDLSLLREASFKRMIISNSATDQLRMVLRDEFYKDAVVLVRKESFTFSNKDVAMSFLRRDLFYPLFMDMETDVRCLAIPEAEMMDLIARSRVAKYILKCWDARLKTKIIGKDYVLIPSTAASKAQNILASVHEFANRLVEPLTVDTFVILEGCSFRKSDVTLLSNVWKSCFASAVIPYRAEQREAVVKKDAPIRRYLS